MDSTKIVYKDAFFNIINSIDLKKKLEGLNFLEEEYRVLVNLLNKLRASELFEILKEKSASLQDKSDQEFIDLLGGRNAAQRLLNEFCSIDRTTVHNWYIGRSKIPPSWRIVIMLVLI